jgi:hypothetical protein
MSTPDDHGQPYARVDFIPQTSDFRNWPHRFRFGFAVTLLTHQSGSGCGEGGGGGGHMNSKHNSRTEGFSKI